MSHPLLRSAPQQFLDCASWKENISNTFVPLEVSVAGGRVEFSAEIAAHFGVDVGISRNVSFFGVGRFDIVDDVAGDFQGKVYVGVRFGL